MKSAKYHLRVHEFKEANYLIMLFGIDSLKKEYNAHLLQQVWYDVELAEAFFRTDNYREALKSYSNVFKHFEVIEKDLQFTLF